MIALEDIDVKMDDAYVIQVKQYIFMAYINYYIQHSLLTYYNAQYSQFIHAIS